MSRTSLPQAQATGAVRTARSLLTRDVPVAAPDDRVGSVIAGLRSRRFESVAAVAVVRDKRLEGLTSLEDVLAAPDDARVGTLVHRGAPVAAPDDRQEGLAVDAAERAEACVAVTDGGRFLGFVPAARLAGVLLAEHREDMARLSGFLHDAEAARRSSQEAVLRRLWHRLPWLLVGLAGALAAAAIMEGFEATLRANVVIAFFLPGIVYLADAVGTQTETLIVRGLSVGVPVRSVVGRELWTGALVGLALALAFAAAGLLVWGDTLVVTVVSLAILAACGTATIVAMTLPALLHRLGADPAFGSGPLATVAQDLLSIVTYLLIATALLG